MFTKHIMTVCALFSFAPLSVHAMKRGSEDRCELPSKQQKTECISLHAAVRENDAEAIEKCLKSFKTEVATRILKKDDKGRTALYIAASKGLKSAADVLCRYGATPYVRCFRSSVSPFEAAALHGHIDIMKLFCEHKQVDQARIVELTSSEFSVFHRIAAARMDYSLKKKAFDFLKEHNIGLSMRVGDEHAPYLAAVWVGDSQTAKLLHGKEHADEICYAKWRQKALESVKSDAASDPKGDKFLELMSVCGDTFILDELMRTSQELLTSPSNDGCWLQLKKLWQSALTDCNDELYTRLFTTKWHNTYAANHLIVKELVRLAQIKDESKIAHLIKLGVDINTQDEITGETALHRVRMVESAALLCKFGASRDVVDADSEKPSIIASLEKHEALQAKPHQSEQEKGGTELMENAGDEADTDMQTQATDKTDDSEKTDTQDTQLSKSHQDAKKLKNGICALL